MDLHFLNEPGALFAWLLAGPAGLAVRAALSLAVLPFLYYVLREDAPAAPQAAARGAGAAQVRRVLFALLGAAVFFLLTANWFPEQRSPAQGRGFQAFAKGSYLYRLSYTGAGDPFMREQAVADLRQAVELLPESAYLRRYLGIVLAEQGEYAGARKLLDGAMDRLAERAPERAREERRLWERLFGESPPTAAEIEAASRQLRRYELGWIARVALLAAYERAGEGEAPQPLRREVRDAASRYFAQLLLGLLLPLLVLPQLGLISLVVGLILVHEGVLRPAPRQQHPVSAILWESFILMMALGLAPLFFGGRPAPETQPAQFAFLLVFRDLVQLLAIVYLAWRLRGRGLSLAEVGLTTRHFWANVLVGIMAATVLIPASYLISLATQFVSDRLFPNIAPPYHPLQGMTATSGSAEIRLALFAAAVIGAPVLEEIFFRGALFGAILRRHGFWSAILGSAAFFAVLHPQLPLGFLPLALLGAAFAALYHWRQSLVPAMVAHALNNGLAFLMLSLLFPTRG